LRREFGNLGGGEVGDDVIVAFVERFAAEDNAFERYFAFWRERAIAEDAMDAVPGFIGLAKVFLVPFDFNFFIDEIDEVVIATAGEKALFLSGSGSEKNAATGHAGSLMRKIAEGKEADGP
jgi:hypothetical protein